MTTSTTKPYSQLQLLPNQLTFAKRLGKTGSHSALQHILHPGEKKKIKRSAWTGTGFHLGELKERGRSAAEIPAENL